MKCPVCSNPLTEFNTGDVKIDVCAEGCSGMWLDKSEFERIDNATEQFPPELLRLRKSPNVLIDRSKARSCPKCSGNSEQLAMTRVSLNPDTRFEIDKCGKCDGVWLDLGELEHIRAEDKSVIERKEKLAAYEQAALKGINDAKMKLSVKSLLRKFF